MPRLQLEHLRAILRRGIERVQQVEHGRALVPPLGVAGVLPRDRVEQAERRGQVARRDGCRAELHQAAGGRAALRHPAGPDLRLDAPRLGWIGCGR
jgi:hypothetical protein